jgi:D-alanyl-D-alanine carboxypeptidase
MTSKLKVSIFGSLIFVFMMDVLAAQEISVPAPIGPLTPKNITTYVDALVAELVKRDLFSGAILIAKDGKPFYTKAVGEANKEFRVPNTLETKFNLGSMNKMFTGVAIVQLEQQGKLSFNDRVGKYLPDYPNKDVRDKVTIHHLLTHTSGMGLFWNEFYTNARWAQIKTVKEYDDLANKNPLAFEPGERFLYSNCGPLVLGLIIEKITGMSYDDYVRKFITGPSGMENTDCYDISNPIPNLAVGYTKMSLFGDRIDHWKNNLFLNPVKGGPAGGGYSTVGDLFRFAIALQTLKLTDREHLALLTTGKVISESPTRSGETRKDPNDKYAYLFQEKIVNGHRLIGHSGGAAGIASILRIFTDLGYIVVILSNYDPGTNQMFSKIETLLTREGAESALMPSR